MDQPKLMAKTPAKGFYTAKWKLAKKNFKAVTGKKKPAPTKEDKRFFEKIMTLDNRQGTGIDKTITALEDAIAVFAKNPKAKDRASNAYVELEKAIAIYLKFLETAVAQAPQDVDPALWRQQVVILKAELRRIQLGLKAYVDKLKMKEGALNHTRDLARTYFEDLDEMITVADKWTVKHLWDTAPDNEAYNGEGVQVVRNITQKLTNLHKLPILIGFEHDRGMVSHDLEETLEDFANGRRGYHNLQEYQLRLHELAQALTALRLWLRRGRQN